MHMRLNREILQNKYFQYFDRSKTRHNRAKIGLAGQHDRPPFKNYFEPCHRCTWSEVAWCCPWNLGTFFQIFFCFVCYITNHLMTGPLRNSEYCFPWISMFPETLSRETLRFEGNKIHCSSQDQSLRVNCCIFLFFSKGVEKQQHF